PTPRRASGGTHTVSPRTGIDVSNASRVACARSVEDLRGSWGLITITEVVPFEACCAIRATEPSAICGTRLASVPVRPSIFAGPYVDRSARSSDHLERWQSLVYRAALLRP